MSSKKNKIIRIFKDSSIYQLVAPFFKLKEKRMLKNTIGELVDLQGKSPDEISQINDQLLLRILKHAFDSTLYYSDKIGALHIDINSLSGFKQLPLLYKSTIQSEGINLLSSKFDSNKLAKRFTGGSTGQPMEFFADKYAMTRDNAHHYYLNHVIGLKREDITIGIYGVQLSKKNIEENIFWLKMASDVFGNYHFSSLALNDTTAQKFTAQLLSFKPSIIRGYPSTISTLASVILSSPIPVNFPIKGIILTSELCSVRQRMLIEKAFKTKVYFEYGNKEINIFCYTNGEDYIYRSSPIYSYVEVLNDDGSETAIGEVGKIVTTGFNNYGMPFLRYSTGDLGRLASRNGGVVSFSEIIGRSQDFLIDFDGVRKYLIAEIYSHDISVFQKIKIWQLQQKIKGEVDVLIVPLEQFSEVDKQEIQIPFVKFKNFNFTFHFVTDIPKTKIGKHLFVIQNTLEK